MKKVFLLVMASVIALGSFANNHKNGKHVKKARITVCPANCHGTSCSHS